MSEYTVSVVPCSDYSEENVSLAMDTALSAIGGLDWVRKGMRVLIKANLVAPMKPEKAATTHPALVCELTKRLIRQGAQVVIGDSPGGFFNVSSLNKVYSQTGMELAEALGAELNRNINFHTVDINGKVMHSLTYTSYIDDCDAMIDFCKLKSHGMVGMSGAVKNLYGVIPGLLKPETHYIYPDMDDFANMLVDINEYFRPRLTLIDAVIGMEGNGPTAGTPKTIGVLIASKSTHAADLIASEIIGIESMDVPTIRAGIKRGLIPEDYREISVFGNVEALKLKDFNASVPKSVRFFGNTKYKLAQKFIEACFNNKPKLYDKLCVGCRKCADICPAHAIEMIKNKPHIDRKKCIRCFCCQEFCPRAAMKVHRPLVASILQKK